MERTIKHNEQVVLASLEANCDLIGQYGLTAFCFDDERHQKIFATLNKHKYISPENISWKLWDYFFNNIRNLATTNAQAYISQLLDKKSLNTITSITKTEMEPSQKIEAISIAAKNTGNLNVQDTEEIDVYFSRYLNDLAHKRKIKTAFNLPWIDERIDIRVGGIGFVAGRPGVGKTGLICQLLNNVDVPVYFFSLEMAKEAIYSRMWANKTNTVYKRLLDGDKSELARANKALPNYKPNVLIDTGNFNITAITTMIERNAEKYPLYIIDHTKLIHAAKEKSALWERITDNVHALKECAVKNNVAIICLNQLSRDVEKNNRAPDMADLAGASAIEETADWILTISHCKDWFPKHCDKFLSLAIQKNRYGTIGTCHFAIEFLGGWQQFIESKTVL